tara:strand:+ start:1082 stop:3220 length:2139 start_codon:yes stop_codon:yes gene_type:complete
MQESKLRNLVRQEIINKLDTITEGKDPFVPTYGKGDVVHDCPKHVQEINTGIKGKVTGHTLNESGVVNFVDVDFGTGKVFENIPTNKLKILEMQEHAHNIKEEPITGAGKDEVVTEEGDRCDCALAHPGISHRAYNSQQLAEEIKVLTRTPNQNGSSLGYRLTQKQHKKMLAFLKKNKNQPSVKELLATLKDKYSAAAGIVMDGKVFFVYASYGALRIGTGGKASEWNQDAAASLTKYIGEAVLLEKVTPRQVSKAFSDISKLSMEMIENLQKYKAAKKSGNEADIKKYIKIAGTLSKQKRSMEAAMEKMITQLDKDVEYIGEGKINEAPMDKRFAKEWERNCKVLLTHIKHEESKKNRENFRLLNNLTNQVKDAMNVPAMLAKIVGMQEGKSVKRRPRLTEAFASTKLGQLFGKVTKYSNDKNFLSGMAKSYGLEWDKITDDQVKGPDTKLDRKGIDLIIATQDVNLARTSTYDWTTYIKKGQLLGATIKGKRVWAGRVGISTGAGKNRSFVGLDKRGYSNVKSVLSITGAVVYHIDPELKSRGAGEKQASRAEAKAGATALMKARDVKDNNKKAYQAALRVKAGQEGKGALIKMIETATKMYEKVLKEKLDMLKKGMVSAERWNNDSWSTVSRAHQQMIRDFQYWMREAADQEAQAKKDGPKGSRGGADYMQKSMNNYALNIKTEFNTMNSALKKIDKSTEYSKIEGRAY